MEDQHYNGDIWNKEAFTLLSLFGWSKIGDYDMDVSGDDEKKMGIDTIVSFETPLKTRPQLIILEAKRYLTTSFNKSYLQEWINRLDTKLLKLRNSNGLKQRFPIVEDCTILDTGVIVIWFADIENYNSFHDKFIEAMRQISLSSRQRKAGTNKIFVLDNVMFMKLFALQDVLRELKKDTDITFLYASRFINEEPISRSKVLYYEYMFSDIIFAESGKGSTHKAYIFYFGQLNYVSFELVYSAYSNTSLYDKDIPIDLYVYNKDDEFRKIESEIKERIFDGFDVKIKYMVSSNNIPSYIQNALDND